MAASSASTASSTAIARPAGECLALPHERLVHFLREIHQRKRVRHVSTEVPSVFLERRFIGSDDFGKGPLERKAHRLQAVDEDAVQIEDNGTHGWRICCHLRQSRSRG